MSIRTSASMVGLAGVILAGACVFSPHGTLEGGQGDGGVTTTGSATSGTSTTGTTATTGSTTTKTTTGSAGGGGTGVGHCQNATKDADESDQDCGGTECPPCAHGKACNGGADCNGGYCVDGMCCATDCSGPCVSCKQTDTNKPDGTCAPTGATTDPGGKCTAASQGTCDGKGKCVCANDFKDEGEIDVDCGGSCGKCGGGKTCTKNGDCASDTCVDTGAGKKICCDVNCKGPCVSCTLGSFVGQCKPRPIGHPCGGGKGCDGSLDCVGGNENGVGCGQDSDCMSGQCSSFAGDKCSQNDPPGYPCGNGFDCKSLLCDATTHLCL